jgi:hypothetical protein
MNKQRLLELAGITEAKLAGSDGNWVVCTYGDGYFYVTGPFANEQEANRYIEWEVEEFGLEAEEDKAQAVKVEDPQW